MIGQRLGPYEITAKLGEGGMGEVYRATDTKLKRDVAIKVLPTNFTEDKERLARFEREAQLLAQLHHPNIASIFGLEESEGTRALVMELVDGPTLAERLEQGPLSFDECLPVSLQIAQALEEAHEKGIVHRDLKPQNIKASIAGKVKVLDFGLAKATDPAAGSAVSAADLGRSPTLMNSPTLTAVHGTQLGVILGTAAYMAPEQAKGLPIDKRADIWAFGVVLFEMLSGRSLFAADTVTDTLAGVLRAEIDFAKLPASTPAAIRRLLRRCLERNPKNRLRDIGDARLVLEELASSGGAEPVSEIAAERAAGGRLPWAIAAASGLVALVAVALALRASGSAAPRAPTRTSLQLPSPIDSEQQPGTFALAPDGGAVVFRAGDGAGKRRLFVRELAELAARPLEGSEGAIFPFWSADSRHVAFFAGGELLRAPRAGGAAQRVAAAKAGRGGAWSRDGTIIFAPEASGPLWRVRASGGEAAPATLADGGEAGEESHRFPLFLPDGRHFLFLADTSAMSDRVSVRVAALESVTAGRELLEASSAPRFAPPGELVFPRDGALLAQAIDLERLEMIGEPRQLDDRSELRVLLRGAPVVDLADDGRMLYAPPDPRPSALVWLDRRGVELGSETRGEEALRLAAISRRGERIAVMGQSLGTGTSLWALDPGQNRTVRITSPRDFPWGVIWSADSQALITWLGADGSRSGGSLSLVATANGEVRRLLSPSNRWIQPTDTSADGSTLLYWELLAGRGHDIGWLRLAGEPQDTVYLSTPSNEDGGRLSPDGRWIAYLSDASGRREAFVDTFPRPTRAQRVATDGEVHEVDFRSDGQELFLVASEGGSSAVFACDLRFSERPEIGTPRKLFSLPRDWTDLEPAPAGDRFLLVRPAGVRWPSLILVDGWRAQVGPER
jgi:Tol biopolymer transport system component